MEFLPGKSMFFAFATSGENLKKPELKSYIDAKMATTQQNPTFLGVIILIESIIKI